MQVSSFWWAEEKEKASQAPAFTFFCFLVVSTVWPAPSPSCPQIFPVKERLYLCKPHTKGNLSYRELLLVGYWSRQWAWINWILFAYAGLVLQAEKLMLHRVRCVKTKLCSLLRADRSSPFQNRSGLLKVTACSVPLCAWVIVFPGC